jgi:hypothetical protein
MSGQRAFCALSVQSSKVAPISLNTLKALAGELYSQEPGADGNGFALLNRMRVQLKELIETTPSVRSVEAKNKRHTQGLDGAASKLHAVELQNVSRSKAYLDLYSKLNTFVKKEALDDSTRFTLFKLLEKHYALFGDLFHPPAATPSDAGAGGDGTGGTGGIVVPMPIRKGK